MSSTVGLGVQVTGLTTPTRTKGTPVDYSAAELSIDPRHNRRESPEIGVALTENVGQGPGLLIIVASVRGPTIVSMSSDR